MTPVSNTPRYEAALGASVSCTAGGYRNVIRLLVTAIAVTAITKPMSVTSLYLMLPSFPGR